jgi:hypothetical protein
MRGILKYPKILRKQAILMSEKLQHIDVKPGGNKARLTLSDGSNVVLESTGNGMVPQQGSTKIVKLDKGLLAYKSVNEDSGEISPRRMDCFTLNVPIYTR